MGVFHRILHAGEGRRLKELQTLVPSVSALEPEMERRSDDDLRATTATLRARVEAGEDLDAMLPEAFATVREAGRRVLGQRHFDVQLMGGAALHYGWVAEMKTGEGKTLSSTLAAYLNAIGGRGVHLVTVNEYLARSRRRVDGPDPSLPRPGGRGGRSGQRLARREAPGVRRRHHVRNEQRVRVRLPARQHDRPPRSTRSSGGTTSRSSTRSTRSSSTRRAPR